MREPGSGGVASFIFGVGIVLMALTAGGLGAMLGGVSGLVSVSIIKTLAPGVVALLGEKSETIFGGLVCLDVLLGAAGGLRLLERSLAAQAQEPDVAEDSPGV